MLIHPYSFWVRGNTILGWYGPLILISGGVVVGGGGSGGGTCGGSGGDSVSGVSGRDGAERSVTRDDLDSVGRSW